MASDGEAPDSMPAAAPPGTLAPAAGSHSAMRPAVVGLKPQLVK